MGKILKGIPIPLELVNQGTKVSIRGGHTPIYPFREMEVGDYWEERVIDTRMKKKMQIALRNTRKNRPDWSFVYQIGLSIEPERTRTGLPYFKVWRVADQK